MIWIILTVVFGLVGLVLLGIGKREVDNETTINFAWIAPIVFVIWLLITVGMSVRMIGAGHVGIVYQFGAIVDQRGEGLNLIAPWQNMRTESIQVQRTQFEFGEGNSAFSAETQDVFMKVTINYSIAPAAVQGLYRNIGPDWFDRLVETRVRTLMKEETVKYLTVDIAPNREKIRTAVRDRLRAELERFSINVDDLLIDNVDFRPEFKQAIENKQIATQDALQAKERVAQRRAEADQRIEQARGDAQAVLIAAQAQADANKLLSQSLTPELIQFTLVQRLAGNIKVALLPVGQNFLINPDSLLQEPTPTATP